MESKNMTERPYYTRGVRNGQPVEVGHVVRTSLGQMGEVECFSQELGVCLGLPDGGVVWARTGNGLEFVQYGPLTRETPQPVEERWYKSEDTGYVTGLTIWRYTDHKGEWWNKNRIAFTATDDETASWHLPISAEEGQAQLKAWEDARKTREEHWYTDTYRSGIWRFVAGEGEFWNEGGGPRPSSCYESLMTVPIAASDAQMLIKTWEDARKIPEVRWYTDCDRTVVWRYQKGKGEFWNKACGPLPAPDHELDTYHVRISAEEGMAQVKAWEDARKAREEHWYRSVGGPIRVIWKYANGTGVYWDAYDGPVRAGDLERDANHQPISAEEAAAQIQAWEQQRAFPKQPAVEEKIEGLQGDVAYLRSALKDSDRRLSEMGLERTGLREQIELLHKENNGLQDEIDELETAADEDEDEINELTTQVSELKEELSDLREELQLAQTKQLVRVLWQ